MFRSPPGRVWATLQRMTSRLEDKVAIITGAGSGIGRASALRFAAEGARVLIAEINADSAEHTLQLARERLGANQDRVIVRRCDVSLEQDIAAVVAEAVSVFGRLDCMFNNAGLVGAIGPLAQTTVDAWDRTFAVLVRSVFLGIKHAAPVMRERGGTIINTASIAGMNAGAGPTAYSASKAAVISLTRSAAVELAPQRIRVNALCPGLILSPMLERGQASDLERVLCAAQPWPEAGMPEHIADVALFLASDESRFVTGEALVADGGITARGPGVFAQGNAVGKAIANNVSKSVRERGENPGALAFDPANSE
jgi:NAD(P)-dependent dehydrogenase (short-subunit alcohol dehydrogenase family)